jgi:hypothetical protein
VCCGCGCRLTRRQEEIIFCDGCGTTVQFGQTFCSKCGKQIIGSIAVMPQRPGRVQGHVQLLGILWLAISAFNTIGGPPRFCVRC